MDSRNSARCYEMGHARRGVCVIISMENYMPHMNLERRPQADALKLANCFTKLDFEVFRYHDLDYDDLLGVIDEWRSYDHSHCDAFAMCFLSYGLDDLVYHTTGKMPVEELLNPFSDVNCRTLSGKPKLFFLQLTPRYYDSMYEYNHHAAVSSCIPRHPDFVVCMYNSVQTRSRGGSWFLGALDQLINEEKVFFEENDIFSILTRLNNLVSNKIHSEGLVATGTENPYPQIMTTLRKMLFFTKSEKSQVRNCTAALKEAEGAAVIAPPAKTR